MTVFPPDKNEWYSVLTTALAVRKEAIPEGLPDEGNHIAVVPVGSDFSYLSRFGFNILATVDSNGHVDFFQPKEAGS